MARQLTLVIHSLEGGGAERMFATMANHWAAMGHRVTLLTLAPPEGDKYEISPSVQRICLDGMQDSSGLVQAVIHNFRRLLRLRRAIDEANGDAVISFTDKMNVLTLLASVRLRKRVVICERVDPRRHAIARSWGFLRRLTYAWCDTLVVQTKDIGEYCRRFVTDSKIRVIANAVRPPAITKVERPPRESWIVAIGRLEKQKGFDLLIEAFATIAYKCPDWRLKILGAGSEREALAEQVHARELDQTVALCDWVEAPESWINQSELFVLSSRYEGFPNALLEAMAAGVPAISFACESGPSEIIRHEIDGLLVPAEDVDALARAIERLISNPEERQAFGQRALEVTERFSFDRMFQCWEDILDRQPGTPLDQRKS